MVVCVCVWCMYACYSYYEENPEDELQVVDGCACACVWWMYACYSYYEEDPEDELQVVGGCVCVCVVGVWVL